MEKHIKVPMTREEAKQLKAGDYVYLTGTIYTARDAAHKRMQETLTAGKELPISIDGTIIYYMGPSRRGKEDRSVLQDRQPRAEWISMHHSFWIWDFSA